MFPDYAMLRRIAILAILAACCLSGASCDRRTTTMTAASQPRLFYGKVIDQDGNPVRDAEIVVQLSEMTDNAITAGSHVPDRLPKNHFSVYSGVTGSFLITVPPPNYVIEIEAVKKDGYDWVIDLAWTLGVPPHNDGDNRLFMSPGAFSSAPVYQPDSNRPAIFPLHRKGDPAPATQPSRGGSDRTREGKTVVNEPTELRVPSAGPNAPGTNDDISKRIGEYADSFNAAQRAKLR